MEKQTIEMKTPTQEESVRISRREAEEYRAYKRKQLQADIVSALSNSESSILNGEDAQRVCERAIRLRQAAVKAPLTRLALAARYLAGSKVKLDCVVGGTGETLTKVKMLEARLAAKKKAAEITVVVAPSLVDSCRYSEIRKEIKRVRRAAGKVPLKVRVEQTDSLTALARIARIACETGARFFSVPYFQGCERLGVNFTRGCALEVSGVDDADAFRTLSKAGVARIVTDRGFEIYAEWLKKGYEELVSQTVSVTKEEKTQTTEETEKTEKTEKSPAQTGEQTDKQEMGSSKNSRENSSSETDYRCRLEGTKLTFY